ncbi:MAG: L,D-transpeptidase [Sandaracinus sp.]|nr:L,D-transpeptidase [Sandaracinus sp.]
MLAPGTRVDRLVVDKSERSLVAYEGEREVARLRVAIGFGGEGPKRWGRRRRRTPEGTYRIDRRRTCPATTIDSFTSPIPTPTIDRRRYAALREAGELAARRSRSTRRHRRRHRRARHRGRDCRPAG